MTVDHIAKILITDPALQFSGIMIGRFAMVAFCWIIAINFLRMPKKRSERHVSAYIARLFIVGIISKILLPTTAHLNIFFTLAASVMILEMYQQRQFWLLGITSLIFTFGVPITLFEGTIFAVYLPLTFVLAYRSRSCWLLPYVTCLVISFFVMSKLQLISLFVVWYLLQIPAPTPTSTLFYRIRACKFSQLAFYLYYPAHLWILYFLASLQ